jgi:CheY-like chemotaxis protein
MPKKILIIDDDPDVVLFLATMLKDQGYTTVEARNGQEGIEKARKELPDLILLDLMMPQKSGISLLSDLKKDADLKKIPVIMVTGVSGETGIDLESFFQRSSTSGENDGAVRPQGLIEKPVDPEKLLRLVKKVFE